MTVKPFNGAQIGLLQSIPQGSPQTQPIHQYSDSSIFRLSLFPLFELFESP